MAVNWSLNYQIWSLGKYKSDFWTFSHDVSLNGINNKLVVGYTKQYIYIYIYAFYDDASPINHV